MFNCKSKLILSLRNYSDKVHISKISRPYECNEYFYFGLT